MLTPIPKLDRKTVTQILDVMGPAHYLTYKDRYLGKRGDDVETEVQKKNPTAEQILEFFPTQNSNPGIGFITPEGYQRYLVNVEWYRFETVFSLTEYGFSGSAEEKAGKSVVTRLGAIPGAHLGVTIGSEVD
jgi:hypothetical protein